MVRLLPCQNSNAVVSEVDLMLAGAGARHRSRPVVTLGATWLVLYPVIMLKQYDPRKTSVQIKLKKHETISRVLNYTLNSI